MEANEEVRMHHRLGNTRRRRFNINLVLALFFIWLFYSSPGQYYLTAITDKAINYGVSYGILPEILSPTEDQEDDPVEEEQEYKEEAFEDDLEFDKKQGKF